MRINQFGATCNNRISTLLKLDLFVATKTFALSTLLFRDIDLLFRDIDLLLETLKPFHCSHYTNPLLETVTNQGIICSNLKLHRNLLRVMA